MVKTDVICFASGQSSSPFHLVIAQNIPQRWSWHDWDVFQVCVFESLMRHAECSKWHRRSCAHTPCYDSHYVEKVCVFFPSPRFVKKGLVKTGCLFYVKLNKIGLWASLLPVPLSVLCSFPFPNKAASPRCINAHQRPQSTCFATG